VLAQERWEVVSFSAIAEADELHRIETIWGPRCFERRPGEALHPDREPLEVLDHIRRTIGEYNFAGQYHQSPAPLGGGLVKATSCTAVTIGCWHTNSATVASLRNASSATLAFNCAQAAASSFCSSVRSSSLSWSRLHLSRWSYFRGPLLAPCRAAPPYL
jgi:hypothetical protein